MYTICTFEAKRINAINLYVTQSEQQSDHFTHTISRTDSHNIFE